MYFLRRSGVQSCNRQLRWCSFGNNSGRHGIALGRGWWARENGTVCALEFFPVWKVMFVLVVLLGFPLFGAAALNLWFTRRHCHCNFSATKLQNAAESLVVASDIGVSLPIRHNPWVWSHQPSQSPTKCYFFSSPQPFSPHVHKLHNNRAAWHRTWLLSDTIPTQAMHLWFPRILVM